MFQPHEVPAGVAPPKDYKWQLTDRNKPISNRHQVDCISSIGAAQLVPPQSAALASPFRLFLSRSCGRLAQSRNSSRSLPDLDPSNVARRRWTRDHFEDYPGQAKQDHDRRH